VGAGCRHIERSTRVVPRGRAHGLWVGAPTYAVSVMELTGDLVTHETQYFADPFPAPASRAALATST